MFHLRRPLWNVIGEMSSTFPIPTIRRLITAWVPLTHRKDWGYPSIDHRSSMTQTPLPQKTGYRTYPKDKDQGFTAPVFYQCWFDDFLPDNRGCHLGWLGNEVVPQSVNNIGRNFGLLQMTQHKLPARQLKGYLWRPCAILVCAHIRV